METIERNTASRFNISFAGAATSGTANLDGRYPILIENTDASGPTSLNVEVLAADGTTWMELYSAGSIVAITLVAQKFTLVPDEVMKACMGRTIRFKNGSSITKTLYLYTAT